MDTVRYVVAVLALITYSAGVVFWVMIHTFVGHWRRLGATTTYVVVFSLLGGWGWLLYQARSLLLGGDLGTSMPLLAVSVIVLVGGLAIEHRCRQQLSLRTLSGLPELKGETESVLLQDGIFGRVRHPRYLGGTLGMVATALFANYVGTYVLALLFLPGIYLVTVLEERELVERFGDTYRDYQRRVPRLVPHLGKQ